MDADIRALKGKVEDLTRATNRLANVLEALNVNFVEFVKMIKALEEETSVPLGGDPQQP